MKNTIKIYEEFVDGTSTTQNVFLENEFNGKFVRYFDTFEVNDVGDSIKVWGISENSFSEEELAREVQNHYFALDEIEPTIDRDELLGHFVSRNY